MLTWLREILVCDNNKEFVGKVAIILLMIALVASCFMLAATMPKVTNVDWDKKQRAEKLCLDNGYKSVIVHEIHSKDRYTSDITMYCRKKGELGKDIIVPIEDIE